MTVDKFNVMLELMDSHVRTVVRQLLSLELD